jgi:hypothetical protein
MQPGARVPAPNAVRLIAPNAVSPGRSQDAARGPYKPAVKIAAQNAVQTRQPGVQYELSKPVKDAIQRFERK